MIKLTKIYNNLHVVELEDIKIWFSYETPVAFYRSGDTEHPSYIAKNQWSRTTGRHLNIIDDDKSKRISYSEFVILLKKSLNG